MADTIWPTKPQILTIRPFMEEVSWPLLLRVLTWIQALGMSFLRHLYLHEEMPFLPKGERASSVVRHAFVRCGPSSSATPVSSCFHHPQVSPGEYTPVPDLLSAIPVFLFLCQMTSVDGLHPDSSPSLLKLSLLTFYHPASSFCPLVSLLNTSPCGCLGVP